MTGAVSNLQVHIFDLSVRKYQAVCCQAVVPRAQARLNTIAFNIEEPLVSFQSRLNYEK